jgi:thiol-disulfide isomerase/thioredoxin
MSTQSIHKKLIPLLLLLTLLTLAGCTTSKATVAPTATPAPKTTAPQPTNTPAPAPTTAPDEKKEERPVAKDFTATNLLTGEDFKLSDFRGKIVFINFWGSWCPPCRAEMPAFQEVFEAYGDKIVIIGVGINDSDENLIKFAKSIGITYPITSDRTSEIARHYRIRSLPTTYRINQKGEIQGVAQGGLTKEQLIQAIESLQP